MVDENAAGRGAAGSRDERVSAELAAMLFRTAPAGMAAALFAALVLAGTMVVVYGLNPRVGGAWLGFVLVDFAVRLAICFDYRRAAAGTADWRAATRRFTLASIAGGLVWGVGAFWLMSPASVEQQLVVMLFVTASASGAVLAFGGHLPSALAGNYPLTAPFVIWCLGRGDAIHAALFLMGVTYILAVAGLALNANRVLREATRLRLENLDLVEGLKRQKEVAEAANLAKSRFLAAASHDLRQPVHALGMFVGALRDRPLDAESARYVEHISGSVDSLDDLFTSLLDISRLDAGVVQIHVQAFAVAPLLSRVCGEFAAEARAKGVEIAVAMSSACVESDPLLVERILRNLLSNAVRNTANGRVLAGCRRGARLSVEVWDTGRGIPAAERERVFEEFYQLDNRERDRAKGLGLGLAIVRRLSLLLQSPVELRSAPGKGTAVKFSLPLARGAPATASPMDAPAGLQRAGLILVIDDEAPIRLGMIGLLTSWGHQVIAANSGRQMLERLASCTLQPDLVICDYRLANGENGVEAIKRLQSEYNAEIPAMLITGDTGPDRLAEAQSSGFLLLHKPVPSAKLRAAIGNLMRMAEGAP